MRAAGRQITSEIYNVAEADFSHEVTIRSNTIDSQIGGILVYFIQNGNYAPGPWPNHHTIEISNNTILNAAYTPVLVTSTTGVAVTGNTVVNALCSAPISGTTFGFIPKGADVCGEQRGRGLQQQHVLFDAAQLPVRQVRRAYPAGRQRHRRRQRVVGRPPPALARAARARAAPGRAG